MQKFNVIEQFEIISKEIISLTQEIAEIIKKNNFDETSDILTIEDRYLKREQSIEELNNDFFRNNFKLFYNIKLLHL